MRREKIWVIVDRAGTLALLAASCLVIWNLLSGGWPASRASRADDGGDDRLPPAIANLDLRPMSDGTTLGSNDASVVLLEFSDFQCPFCGRYARDTFPRIARDFVATGKVRYVFRNFPLAAAHPLAAKAAEAAECAGDQGKYWPMHKRLFAEQAALTPSALAEDAQALGLDPARFDACLQGQKTARLEADKGAGTRLGVRATPTFFVGRVEADGKVRIVRKITGARSYAEFRRILESAQSSD